MKLARSASNDDVRDRFITIARHYHAFMQAEERNSERDQSEN